MTWGADVRPRTARQGDWAEARLCGLLAEPRQICASGWQAHPWRSAWPAAWLAVRHTESPPVRAWLVDLNLLLRELSVLQR